MPPAYCRAYSCFGIKCVVAPEIPNNWASLSPFHMVIPEGCILNAPRPYPVSVRHVVGQFVTSATPAAFAASDEDRDLSEQERRQVLDYPESL